LAGLAPDVDDDWDLLLYQRHVQLGEDLRLDRPLRIEELKLSLKALGSPLVGRTCSANAPATIFHANHSRW
jgi:hypothetical protein